jgi:hypothetical protein
MVSVNKAVVNVVAEASIATNIDSAIIGSDSVKTIVWRIVE